MFILGKVFRTLSAIFSSQSVQTQSALRALRLVTRLAVADVSDFSYGLFKTIMGSGNLTDQHWEAARLAIHGAFQQDIEVTRLTQLRLGELKEILEFLDHHIGLQAAGGNHTPSIVLALEAVIKRSGEHQADPLIAGCVRKFNCTSPSFAKAMRSIMHPDNTFKLLLTAVGLIARTSEQWFDCTAPITEPEEMSEFCEHLAVFVIHEDFREDFIQSCGVIILFDILRSAEWRKHIAPRFWSVLVYPTSIEEENESFRWCLQNAVEILEFTRGLPDGEGLKWWYWMLWFHYDKLDTTVQDEVERVARDMSLGDSLSDLKLYLVLIGQEITRIRQEVDIFSDEARANTFGMGLRARLVALEGNYRRLDRITGQRQ